MILMVDWDEGMLKYNYFCKLSRRFLELFNNLVSDDFIKNCVSRKSKILEENLRTSFSISLFIFHHNFHNVP